MTADLALMSAPDLVALFRSGDASPVEATEAVLAQIAALNPVLNAFCWLDEESARQSARESEARWRQGSPLSLLPRPSGDSSPAPLPDARPAPPPTSALASRPRAGDGGCPAPAGLLVRKLGQHRPPPAPPPGRHAARGGRAAEEAREVAVAGRPGRPRLRRAVPL